MTPKKQLDVNQPTNLTYCPDESAYEDADLGCTFEDPERERQTLEDLIQEERLSARLRRSILETSHQDHLKNSIEGLLP